MWRPEHEISGRGVKATHSNADFAKDLLWDLACFLQWLVQGATILWTTDGDKWRGFKIKICEKQHISSKIACYHADQAVNGGQEIPNNFQYSLFKRKQKHYWENTGKHNINKLYHMLHADADFPIAVESPVEAHNIWGVALM